MPEVLPELGALAAAGLLILIAAALWILQDLIRNSFGRLPVVGSWVSANIDSALNDARNAVLSGASATWGAASQMFRWMSAAITNPIEWAISFAVQVYWFASRVVSVYIPAAEARVAAEASSLASSAESYALGLSRSVTSYAAGIVASAVSTAQGLFTTARNDAVTLFDSATVSIAHAIITAETDAANLVTNASSTLAADIRAAESIAASEISGLAASVQSAVNTLSGDIVSGVATAEAVAASRLASVSAGIYTDLETWGDKAVTEAWPDATGELAALRQALGADFPWLNDLIGSLAGAGALGLAGALIRSMATSQAVTRLATDCIVPQCRNLGGLSNDLGNLLGDVSTAAMLAWLIFAVTDPAGWASEMVTVAGPVAQGTADAASALFQGV